MKSSQLAFDVLYRPQEAFVSGVTPESRQASRSGAEAAERVRTRNIDVIRELWRTPKTLNEVAEETGLPITSVCSLKAGIEGELKWAGYQRFTLADGRKTRRSRWQMRAARRDG